MSVIVKGMYMPTNCRDCIFCHFYSISGYTKCDIGLKVLAYDYKPILFDGKPNWCPLIEIPKGAKLLDGNKMKDKTNIQLLKTWIDVQPTIYEDNNES